MSEKKKCGILTFHRAINYGAVLQAYALRRYIKDKFFIDCDVIDYRCSSIEEMYKLKGCILSPKATLKKIIMLPKTKKFKKFLYKNIEIGASVERSELNKESEKYDIIITGSDQVWGRTRIGKDHSYFLDFVDDTYKKASYAASMGSGIIGDDVLDIYKELLKDFKYISVREHQAKESISALLNRNVEESIDPTLLLSKEEWKNIASNKFDNKKYLLVYTLTESPSLMKVAKEIAQKKGLEIYHITDAFRSQSGIRNLRGLSPLEWVSAFMNASYVVTNSFHGTAFAINFHIDFNSEISQSISNRGARIADLLNLVNLQDRLIDKEYISETVDFGNIDYILNQERQKSYRYLKHILNGEEHEIIQ